MAVVHFTAHLSTVAPPDPLQVGGGTVRQVLECVWRSHQKLKGYVLDDQERVRKHIAIFIDGTLVRGQAALDCPVGASTEIHVLQALSGGCL
ncbi:MAG: MoaD/ThiS family protein [Rhodospirillaceae bacterium]